MTFAVNVVHHVPPQNWQNFLNEMYRVLKPGGIAAVFEHNPVNPLTRVAVARCEFDRDAVLLSHPEVISLFQSSGFEITEEKYIVFFPFKPKIFRRAEKILSWFPLGAQHYTAGKKKMNRRDS
jgi:SAM-dependent methyltransferase